MRLNTKKLAIATVFAALYAVGVIYWPLSFAVLQVRVADLMLPLSMIFGFPAALGLSLGCLVSNSVSGGLGIIDIVGGATANLVACTLAWYIGRKGSRAQRFLGSVAETVVVGLIVGGYLSLLLHVPLEISLLGVLIGEIIAVNLIGFPIEEAIRRSKIFRKYS